MSKHEKKGKKSAAEDRNAIRGSAPGTQRPHPPKKQPIMLVISIALFALWFVFLLVTAVWG